MFEEVKGLKPPEKWTFKDPYVQALCEKKMKDLRPTLFSYVDHWASVKPNDIAIIEFDTGEEVTWGKFAQASKAFAARLLEYGLKKGDMIATSLPYLKEHIFLMYGCLRIGVIFAPLDLRLQVREINHCFERIRPKMYFFLGETTRKDFRPIVEEVMKSHAKGVSKDGSIEHWIQFQQSTKGVIKGAIHAKTFAKSISYTYVWNSLKEYFGWGVYWYEQQIRPRDPAFIIFTTGSTGASKPALLHHEGVLLQNMATDLAFFYPARREMLKKEKETGEKNEFTLLVNLPPSHVAGLTEQFMSGVLTGIRNVVLHVFDPKKSMEAIQKYKCSGMGQIPACFNLEWALPDFEEYDTSSLEIGIYGGQQVSREFLVKMGKMCGRPGSSYGITELSGLITFTPFDSTPDEILQSIGFDTPCCRISVREPMNEDGSSGRKLPQGSVGEICCEGPMVFCGYYGMEDVTRKTVSTDGIYYTGDIGSYDDKGLHFVSRRKFVMKPKGFQVFPNEVEDVFLEEFKDNIQFIACVGVEHKLFSQGIVAVVKFHEGADPIPVEDFQKVAKELASYKRPSLYIFVDEFPLNRVRKRDYLACSEIAEEHVKKLRQEGGWDEKKKE